MLFHRRRFPQQHVTMAITSALAILECRVGGGANHATVIFERIHLGQHYTRYLWQHVVQTQHQSNGLKVHKIQQIVPRF